MRFVILIVIVLLAVFAGLVFINYSSESKPVVQEAPVQASRASVETTDVLVARVDIPAGTALSSEMVDKQPWPRNLLVSSFVVSDPANPVDVNGLVARADFKAQQPLQVNLLARQDEAGFLAANLPSGSRAVTLAVDSISGVAGYIFPGDHVDVVIAHNIPQEGPRLISGKGAMGGSGLSGDTRPTTSEVLLANVRVLALNTRPPRSPGRDPNSSNQIAEQEPSPDPSNITLQMSQDEAKKLRLAEKNGTLSLALRSMKDNEDSSVGVPVTLLELSRVEMGGKKAGNDEPKGVVIVRGVMVEAPMISETMAGAYPAMAR